MSNDLRMDAYYYGFEPTGIPEIDKILSAVACAGNAFHHTESWTNDYEWEPHTGKTPVEWIQNAANEAAHAKTIERLTRENTLLLDLERGAQTQCAEAIEERNRLRAALEQIRDYHVIQGMSPALFAEKVLGSPDNQECDV